MVTTTKNAVKECVVIVLYQLRNGGDSGNAVLASIPVQKQQAVR